VPKYPAPGAAVQWPEQDAGQNFPDFDADQNPESGNA